MESAPHRKNYGNEQFSVYDMIRYRFREDSNPYLSIDYTEKMVAKLQRLSNLSKYHTKILYFFLSVGFFSVVYSFLDASHFHGINSVQDKIKDELLKQEVEDVRESFGTFTVNVDPDKQQLKQNVQKVVKQEEEKIEKPSTVQHYFDRLYYSINTACLLGYGDIYPATNVLKMWVSVQSMLTLVLILF